MASAGGDFAPPGTSPLPPPAAGFDPLGLGLLDLDGDDAFDALLVHAGRPGGSRSHGARDADGHLDLLLFEPDTSQLEAWFGRGDGGFEGPLAVDVDVAVGRIALADLDEDGAIDIVVGAFEAGQLQVLLSSP